MEKVYPKLQNNDYTFRVLLHIVWQLGDCRKGIIEIVSEVNGPWM